jgi:hypothetical protein
MTDGSSHGSSQYVADMLHNPAQSALGAIAVDHGSWLEAWPQIITGDGVCAFDEVSAARGDLGRFTGAGIMPLLKQFAGRRLGGFALKVPTDTRQT